MRLFEGPSVHARLSRYGVNHGLSICDVRLPLGRGGRDVGVPNKLLHRRAIEDSEVLVRFGLERRRIVDPDN